MSRSRLRPATSVIVAVVTTTVVWVNAGDLNPPPGPISPTGTTPILASTTPGDADASFKISQPGAYVLRANITGVVGKMGIEVAADGVSIDLQGFELVGVPGSLSGIAAPLAATGVSIHNGVVRNWGQSGIDVRNIDGAVFSRLRAVANGMDGIRVGKSSIVTSCSAHGNGTDGIDADEGASVADCAATQNGNSGFSAGIGSALNNCSARANVLDGINVLGGCTVTACTSYNNGDNGIQCAAGTSVTACTSYGNLDDGIETNEGSTVSGCTVHANGDDGIQVSSGCRVYNNTCDANTSGAGIHVTAGVGDNRIEGNNVTGNLRGIDIDAAGNLVIRNSASGNAPNYDILVGNTVGPTVTSATIAASNNPHANYDF